LTLTDDDKRAIEQYEQEDRWMKWESLSKAHVLLLVACSMGALTQGWDMSAINGATLFWLWSDNGWDSIDVDITTSPSVFVDEIGLVIAAPLISGAFFALFCACPLSVFGRRTILFAAALVSSLASLASGLVHNWRQLLALRLLLGLGTAFESVIVPILLAETSPLQIRGMVVTSWQVFLSVGLFLGFVCDLAVFNADKNWRIMLGLSAIPAFLQLCALPFCEESPRWLLKTGNIPKALQTLQKLHDLDSPIIACGELLLMHAHLLDEIRWIRDAGKSQNSLSKGVKRSGKGNSGHSNPSDIGLMDFILPMIESVDDKSESGMTWSEATESVLNPKNASGKTSSSAFQGTGAGKLSDPEVSVKTHLSMGNRGRVMFATREMRS
jgi:MFS family permease